MKVLSGVLVGLIVILLVPLAVATSRVQIPQEAPRPPIKERELPPGRGFVPHGVDQSHVNGQELPDELKKLLPAPAQFDWRAQGKVTAVKNQGTCGSCYAFAALANIESKMLIDGAGSYDFSENHAKECNWYDRNCNGGNYWHLASLFSKTGTVLESCDPYVAWNTSCNSTCPYIKTLLDWRRICGPSVPTASVLQGYIYNYGPIYTVLYAGDSNDLAWQTEFNNYNGSYVLSYTGSYEPNHAVCIVGWDDNIAHAGGNGAWIVKNSWGTSWGGTCGYGSEKGYFYIAYGSARMGEWSSYIYDWQDYDTNGNLLFYDEGGWTNNWGYGSTTGWGMCKFVPSSDGQLTRVEFWTNDVNTTVDVHVYDSFNGSTLSNSLASEVGNSYSQVGYHSVALSSPPSVTAGNDVYVAVKFVTSSYTFPIPADNAGPDMSATTYISPNGGSGTWFDLGTAGYDNDVAIRLRSTSIAPAISVLPDTVKFGQVEVGGDSSVVLRIKSIGTDTLKVTDINASDPALAVSDTACSLAPAESTAVTVTFLPALAQTYEESLTVVSNAVGSPHWVVPVLGSGVSLVDLCIAEGDIQFDPAAPMDGDAVTIQARVHHATAPKRGSRFFAVAESVLVRFYKGHPDSGGAQIGDDQLIESIEPESSEVAQVIWNTVGEQGSHDIHVLVDPDDWIEEFNEANNRAHKPITVYSKPVVVSMIMSDPSPTSAGKVDFAFVFNRKMDASVAPAVSYGLFSPYDAYAIEADPGWSLDSMSWTGSDTIEADVNDGLNTVRIMGAQDIGGFVMDADTSWSFFIDTVAPSSQASSPSYSNDANFPVSWSTADCFPSSGVATHTVFVMVDGSFPVAWLIDTSDSAAIYSGSDGHFYSFYSVATDNAGNEEPDPGTPDCTTHVDTTSPETPILHLPAEDFVTGDNTPTFVWGQVTKGLMQAERSGHTRDVAPSTPVTYHLQVCYNQDCTDPVIDSSGLVDTSFILSTALSDNDHYWRVGATDMAENFSGFQDPARRFMVDTQPPIISATTDWPDTSFSGPFAVNADIDDPAGIALALLWYRTDLDTLWQADTMAVSKTTYQGFIPQQAAPNVGVEYYVCAQDVAIPTNSHTDPPGAPGDAYSFTAWSTSVETSMDFRGAPKEFALFQNYPDPFNARTEILYALPEASHVWLEVFNILGQRVAVLVDEAQMTGYHNARWDGKDAAGQAVASGLYLYRLRAEKFHQTRKMVLLR